MANLQNNTRNMGRHTTSKKISPRLFLMLVGLLFFSIGSMIVVLVSIQPVIGSLSASHWPATDAIIIGGSMNWQGYGEDRSYNPKINYQFEVEGKSYTGSNFGFGNVVRGSDFFDQIINNHPEGSRITVYYNPDAPTESVIDKHLSPRIAFGLFPLLVAIIGALVFMSGFNLRKREPSRRQARKDAVRFKSGRFNTSIVSLFFVGAWSLFTIPFYILGQAGWMRIIFTLIWVIFAQSFLKTLIQDLRNPYFICSLSPGRIIPGGKVTLKRSLMGNLDRLQNLNISIYCAEKCWKTTKTGNRTTISTSSTDIYLDEIFNGPIAPNSTYENYTFSLPEDAPISIPMNSESGCEWRIKLTCNMAEGSDITLSRPFIVYAKDRF